MSGADQWNLPWGAATRAAALFAVSPVGTGGVNLRCRSGPVRDQWLALARGLLPASVPFRTVPCDVADGRLLGGLDLAATLRAGRPIAERGILAEADGAVLVLAMAERIALAMAARIGAVLDLGEVVLEREGIANRLPSRFGIIALDEGIDDERLPPALLDRMAFHVDLDGVRVKDTLVSSYSSDDIAAARTRLPDVCVGDDVVKAICEACILLGISSIRAPLLALQAARAATALAGRSAVSEDDVALAAALVLAPRAKMLPRPEPANETEEDTAESETDVGSSTDSLDEGSPREDSSTAPDLPLADIVLQAAQAAIPAGLLPQLRLSVSAPSRCNASGRAGALQSSARRGRPAGIRQGEPQAGARLNIIETLRAAAPWQGLRRRERPDLAPGRSPTTRIDIRRADFRVTRHKQRAETTTIFVVDASGSSALHRLAEAKGAVEMLLADCYVRRDQVALLAFRGGGAELILPPTRSLARAKRSLAGQPGGGGTPLASAIDAASALAAAVQRKGRTPTVVLLTDGRANVGRDGRPGRERAEQDALAAARLLRATGLTALVFDTSPHPHPTAQRLAAEMGARYLPLPYADAGVVSQVVRATKSAQRERISAR